MLLLAATAPAFVLGVAAGRAWRRGSVATATVLALGVPALAWGGVALALRSGEGLGELAVLGWLASSVSSVAAAGVTALRGSPARDA